MKSGYPENAKHAELERRSAYQLRLKAVEMLRSSTQFVKSHGDDLGLEYLWKGDEYSSSENSLKATEKNAQYGGQSEISVLVHVIERPITVHYEDSDKLKHCIWRIQSLFTMKTQTKALYLENFLLIVLA